MKDILGLARQRAQEAELFVVSHEETPVLFEANRLKELHTTQGTSISLRVIKDGRIGFASCTNPDDADALVDKAIAVSEFGAQARFEFPSRIRYPEVEVYDPAVLKVELEEMVRLGEELIDLVRQHEPELLCEGGVERATYTVQVQNSRGGHGSYRKSLFDLSVEGTLVRNTDILFVGDDQSSSHPVKDIAPLVQRVKQQLDWARKTAPVTSCQLPVLFTPTGVAGALLAPMLSAFNGRTVLQGASPLQNRLGEQVYDPRISVYDDATLAFHTRSRPCDDEGVSSRRLPLVEKGVVRNFIYDLQTAGLAGASSTGHGERGDGGLPSPGMSTLVIEPGDKSVQDILKNMKEGLVVEQLMGAGQTNILGGDFSGNVLLGYKVENGEIVGRVKDTVLSGNIYQLFRNVVAISSEARWLRGLHIPYICCPDVAIACKG